MGIDILNVDCMEYMAQQPDKSFDLAIVDPPYGLGLDGGKIGKMQQTYEQKDWDSKTPDPEYFRELERVSKNQIIWGANHMMQELARSSPCWIIWDKENDGRTFAEAELAYTSFKQPARFFRMRNIDAKARINKIHPTQKPVRLYQWLLTKFSEPGQRILDTHLGSGSSAIAAHYFGVDFVGCELDEGYYENALKRFKGDTDQIALI